jgi:uncharacterized protein (TIGR03000 family)
MPPAPTKPEVMAARPSQATIVVNAASDAQIYVDGRPATLPSTPRSFITPDLEPGRDFYYTIRAEAIRDGQTVTESRRVNFRAGQVARVDFGNLAPPSPARVTVRLPEDARLYVDNVACNLTTGMRSFETPKLEPGKQYYYTLKAEAVRNGQTQSETRRIIVQAGKQASVDFGDLTSTQAARR